MDLICPACHHVEHDPGSCEECPRCELHTDEALAWIMRVEPELIARGMRIWVCTSSGDVTAWSSREKAVEMLVRDQLESARSDLRIYEAGLPLYVAWLDWFDGKGEKPEKTVWETARLEQHPEWPARPEIMAELRLSILKRYLHEQETVANFRERIRRLERGIPLEDEYGDRIMEWTLDTDEPQAHEDYD